MEFSELVRRRYSVRSYHRRPIPEEVLQRVLDAFVIAPTAANRQPIGVVVLETAGRSEALRRVFNAEWFAEQAPIVICACALPAEGYRRHDGKSFVDVDATIAMDHLILAATDEGLGTCWIAAFDPVAAREVFGLPEGVEPVVLTPLGYPSDTAGAKLRKTKEQLVHWGRW